MQWVHCCNFWFQHGWSESSTLPPARSSCYIPFCIHSLKLTARTWITGFFADVISLWDSASSKVRAVSFRECITRWWFQISVNCHVEHLGKIPSLTYFSSGLKLSTRYGRYPHYWQGFIHVRWWSSDFRTINRECTLLETNIAGWKSPPWMKMYSPLNKWGFSSQLC